MTSDPDLLRQYADHGDEAAFAEVVRRQADLVYSVALRVTANGALAQEVTQTVFTLMARQAAALARYDTLVGWLHTTTRHTAINAVRGEARRHTREQKAAAMQDLTTTLEVNWTEIGPLLDEAVGQLRDDDRKAVLLRFFKNQSHQEIGAALGLSEDTARKRVERALEKLRAYFARRGVTASAALLGGAISANAVQAAPAGWAQQLAPHALAVAGASSGSALLTTLSMILKSPAFLAVAATALVITGVALGMSAKPALSSATPPPSAPSAARTVPTPATSSSPRAMLPPTMPAASTVSVAASAASPANTAATAPHRAEVDMPQAIIDTFLTEGFPALESSDAIAGLREMFNSDLHAQAEVKAAIAANTTIQTLTENDASLPSYFPNIVMDPIYADPPLDAPGANFDHMLTGLLHQTKPEDVPAIQAFVKMLAADPVMQTANKETQAGLAEFRAALAAAIASNPDGGKLVEENPDVLNAVSAMFHSILVGPIFKHYMGTDFTTQQVTDALGTVSLDMMPTSSNLAKMRSSRGRGPRVSRQAPPAGS